MGKTTKAELRRRITEEAKSWLGTPYHHLARVKGAGVDCACFLAEVAERAGASPHIEIAHYPWDWHMHRDDERFLNVVSQYAREIKRGDLQSGDIIMFRFGRAFAHGAIVIDYPHVIHALFGRFVEQCNVEAEQTLRSAPQKYFRAKTL